jgi:hypothetical protein
MITVNTKEIRPVIYIDMDGVLYPWNTEASVEDTFQPGYFNGHARQENMIKCVQALHQHHYDVRILSSVYQNEYAAKEKEAWLKKNGLDSIAHIFVPYGKEKVHYINPDGCNILVDDFTKNLKSWIAQPNNYGIKFFNGVNNKKDYGTWHGFSVDHEMSAKELFISISGIADKLSQIA